MEKRTKTLPVIAAPVITVLLMFIIYAVKGVYPFGSGTVLGGDLYQQYIFNMWAFRDAIRNGELFYDFTSACGFIRDWSQIFFFPHYWIAALLNKEALPNALSFVFVLKFAVISLASAFSFSKLFDKLKPEWVTVIALIYTFSGYDIQYYTNIDWLDAVALFPLLIYALKRMFDGKGKLLFVLILTYLLSVLTYMAFFIVISLIVFVGLYIFVLDEKENRKKHIYSLGSATLISLIASLYPVYNFMVAQFMTVRFNESVPDESSSGMLGQLFTILSSGIYANVYAFLMYIGAELALACVFVILLYSFKNKSERPIAEFSIVFFVLFLIQSIFGPSELLWHGGSRKLFPLRNGFMITFCACFIICYYLTKASKSINAITEKNKFFAVSAPILTVISLAIVSALSVKYFKLTKIYQPASTSYEENKYLVPVIAIIIAVTCLYIGILLLKNKEFKNIVLLVVTVSLVVCNSYSFIGLGKDSQLGASYNGYYSDFDEVKALFENDENKLNRVSNPDLSLITNYPYYTDTPSVSSWINGLDKDKQTALTSLGYATVFTRTLDSGATAFSKALLGTKYSVSKTELCDELYEKTDETDSGFIKYKNRFTLPTGIVFDTSPEDLSTENYTNTFEYQNAIFERLSGEKELFEKAEISNSNIATDKLRDYCGKNGLINIEITSKNENAAVITGTAAIKTKKNSTLYIRAKNEKVILCLAKLDGEKVIINKNAENKFHDNNTVFPASYNNNVFELGCFDGEEVTLEYGITGGNLGDFDFYLMNNSKLASYCNSLGENECTASKGTVDLKVNAPSGGYVFIPLSYSEKWQCTVNGKTVTPVRVLRNFIAVPVENGESSIILTVSRTGAYIAFGSIVFAFIAAVILVLIEKKIKKIPEWLYTVLYYAYMLLFAGAVSVLYVVPVVFTLII